MNCNEARRWAPLYLSGEMEGEELRRFSAHLEECRACAAEIARQWMLDGRMRAALEVEAQPVERVEREVRRQLAASQRRSRRAALAAVVLAAAAAVGIWLLRPAMPPMYADAVLDHRLEVLWQQPRRWRSGSEVDTLAAEAGLSAGQVEALALAGYSLQHAKFCRIAGVRMLHLVFANGARPYSVYLSPQRGGNQAVRTFHSSQEQAAGLATGRFQVVVVSEGPPAQCEELARAAARQLQPRHGSS